MILNVNYIKRILIFSSFALLSVSLTNCIFVKKHTEEIDEYISVDLILKPKIIMGDEILRSEKGDMISLLPKDWFFVDLGPDTPPDIFAVAVNPDYSLSLVFSCIKSNPIIDDIYKEQKLIGIANFLFDKKQKKTLGGLIKNHKISAISSSHMEFVMYQYRTKTQPIFSYNAVFRSTTDDVYEISMIPLNLSGITMPSDFEMETIFTSVLATVRY